MNQTAYYYDTALLPPVYTICGVKLLPFSLGHFLILRQLKSPINAEEVQDVSFIDGIYWLFHALIVCGQTYEENLKMLQDEAEFENICKAFSDNLLKNMEKDKTWNITEKLNLFKSYMGYFMNMPMYEEEGKQDTKGPSGIDWVQGLFSILKTHLGYTESEILNMNFRQSFYLWCSYAEEQGAIKVSNRTTLDQYARAKGLIK